MMSEDGDLIASTMMAVPLADRPRRVTDALQKIPRRLRPSERQVSSARKRMGEMMQFDMRTRGSREPVVGDRKMLVILVEFADVKFKKTREEFDRLMNADNYQDNGNHGSVKDFFRENSFGKLNLTTDVVGIYTLPYPRAYYGGNDKYGSDNLPGEMARTAVEMAGSDVNFADYDSDSDGVVDGVHIVFAGHGEEAGGGGDCIWSHSSFLHGMVDGLSLGRYSCSPELRDGAGERTSFIGVICHEIGHVLGAMDFYDTNYSTAGQYSGTGRWDLMASGSWNGEGALPAHFNPYSKIYDFGWGEVQDGNKATTFTLNARDEQGFVRIDTQTKGEYFLLEYRAQKGFDAHIPGHGLMVYRASENLSRLVSNTVNATHRQQFYPLCANATEQIPNENASSYGYVNSDSAPFPGRKNVNELSDVTTPSMMSWNFAPTQFPLTSIVEDETGCCVTFDVAGGVDGGAYNLKATDSGVDFIALSWKKAAEEQVMLAASTSSQFDIPENRDYQAGARLGENAKVIYCGSSDEFTHKGLESQTYYYYKLYTRKKDGTWTSGRSLAARTQVGVIRKFPFNEDFESGILDDSWTQEYILNEGNWFVQQLPKVSNHALCFTFRDSDSEDFYLQHYRKTRVIMPKIDFTGVKCAVLDIGLRNYIYTTEVEYRASESDDWHSLISVPSQMRKGGTDLTADDFNNGERNYTVSLPNLTSDYEISIVSHYATSGISTSSLEMATVDNVAVKTDFEAITYSSEPFVRTTSLSIPVTLIEGTGKVSSYGVEWTFSGPRWNRVPAEDGLCVLNGLNPGATVKYRTYALLETGEAIVDEKVLTATTFKFQRGEGTADDPYLIGSSDEWNLFYKIVQDGYACKGISFALDKSFSLKYPNKISKEFTGVLDGRGFTITMTGNSHESLFGRIGYDGIIRNLSIVAGSLDMLGYRSSLLAIYNYGIIENCHVKATINPTDYGIFAGICTDNLGIIRGCTGDIIALSELEGANIGIICGFNTGTIADCVSKGHLTCNNNADIGGIASTNYDEDIVCGKLRDGFISNCINYATMEMVRVDDETWANTAGGICGPCYGKISNCINEGRIITDLSLSETESFGGGIAGVLERGDVSGCLNRGSIDVIDGTNEQLWVGEIVGWAYLACVNNSYGAARLPDEGSNIRGIVGMNEESGVSECLYSGTAKDIIAAPASSSAEENLSVLGKGNGWTLKDGELTLDWLASGLSGSIDHILDTTSDSARIRWIVSGDNLESAVLQWRKKGEDVWMEESGNAPAVNTAWLENLEPATVYECRILMTGKDGAVSHSYTESFATSFTTDGSESDPHLINDYDELLAFNQMVACGNDFGQQVVRLNNDIDMLGNKGIIWEPVRSRYCRRYGFAGEFDGRGHILYNMYVKTNRTYAGFFGISIGYVHDLEIVDSEVKSIDVAANPVSYNVYGGVGGIIGSGQKPSDYQYRAERCGFKGNVTGCGAIGGIAGVTMSLSIKDCYVIGTITATVPETQHNKRTEAAGIAGNGNVRDSWFVGTLRRENQGKSYGMDAISYDTTGKYPNENCYYDVVCIPHRLFWNDTECPAEEMKDPSFLDNLTPGVWSQSPQINDGLPSFASRGGSRVTTLGAEHDMHGDVKISGLYTPGFDNGYVHRGIQWFAKKGDGIVFVNSSAAAPTNNFNVLIANNSIASEGINFRAYAVNEANDSIFGQWKSFEPRYVTPNSYIHRIEHISANEARIRYDINPGSFGLTSCRLEIIKNNQAESLESYDISPDSNEIEFGGLEPDNFYEARIVVYADNNEAYTSRSITWLHREDKVGLPEQVENKVETVNVYSIDGVPVLIDAVESQINTLPAGLYIVNGKKVVKK